MAQEKVAVGTEYSLRQMAGLWWIGCVFTVVGGYMDAYSFIVHGGVFATAQTGNVVLFAVYASQSHWGKAVRHIPSVLAFIVGVITANFLGVLPQKRSYRGTLLCQGIEFAILCFLALFSGFFPDDFIVPIISFIAALQNTSFSTLGPWTFNSAITTGNIQNACTGAAQWFMGRDMANNRGKTLVSLSMAVSFFIGALAGSILSLFFPGQALWPCALLVSIGFSLTWRQRMANLKSSP